MQMVAPPACSSRRRFITASPLVESRLPVGSSASRMDGLPATGGAGATRRVWPPRSGGGDGGCAGVGARGRGALLLTARALGGVVLHAVRHPDLEERLPDALAPLLRA